MSKVVIGVDPDSKANGVAVYIDKKLSIVDRLDLMEIVDLFVELQSHVMPFELHIEDVCANNCLIGRYVLARNPYKKYLNWRVDTRNISTYQTFIWECRNNNSTLWSNTEIFNGDTSINGQAVCGMFDMVNFYDANWSENNRFYNTHAHSPYRIWNFRRTAGGVDPKNSFARTTIRDVFGATANTGLNVCDYWMYVADDVNVYDSDLHMFGGNNAASATLLYAGGDMTNTTLSAVRIETGAGYVMEIGPGGIRKARMLDVDDYLGFSDGLINGTYPAQDNLEMVSIYPGVRSPTFRQEDLSAVTGPFVSTVSGRMHAGVISLSVKDAWNDIPLTRPRGAYIATVSGAEDGTPSATFYANDDSNSSGSAAVGVIGGVAAGTGGETLEIQWPSGNSRPQIRWTSGTRTDDLDLRFMYSGCDDGS